MKGIRNHTKNKSEFCFIENLTKGSEIMQDKAKYGICHKFVNAVPVENPRVKGEINYVCKEHGVVNEYVELEKC